MKLYFLDIFYYIIIFYFRCFVVEHLMATIDSCIKQNAMKKIGPIFDGVIAIWFLLVVASTFLSMCLSGMCSPEWLHTNVVLGSVAEIIFFVWLVRHIQRGASFLAKETKSLLVVRTFCVRVIFLSVIVILFGFITFNFSSKSFYYENAIFDNESDAALIYLVNIAGIALLILAWMCIEIHRINKSMRF